MAANWPPTSLHRSPNRLQVSSMAPVTGLAAVSNYSYSWLKVITEKRDPKENRPSSPYRLALGRIKDILSRSQSQLWFHNGCRHRPLPRNVIQNRPSQNLHEIELHVSYRQKRTTIRHSSTRSDWWYYRQPHSLIFYTKFIKFKKLYEIGLRASYRQMKTTFRNYSARFYWWYYRQPHSWSF